MRVLAAAIGTAAGILLFALLYEGYDRIGSTPPVETEEIGRGLEEYVGEDGTIFRPASRYAFRVTPWFHRFAGRAVNMRAGLAPFSAVVCDSQLRPGEEPSCRIARHNSHGFRGPEYTISRPPNTFRVLVIGDSFTWGDGIDAEDVYHRRLQQRLDAARPPDAPRVEVVALGVQGSNTWDEVIRLLVHGARLQPDLVLVQYCSNDLEYRGYAELLAGNTPQDRLSFFVKGTAIGRTLNRLAARGDGGFWWAEMQRQYDPESLEWKLFEAALDDFARWRSESGVPVAFLSFTDVDRNPEGRNFGRYQPPPRHIQLVRPAERAIEDRGFPVLRTLDVFSARAGDRFLAVSTSNAHYNPLANELVAAAAFEFLEQAEWIDLASPRKREADRRWAAEQGFRRAAEEAWSEYHQSHARQLQLFTRLAELFPDDPWIAETLAGIHRERGDFGSCRAAYARLGELAPRYAAPWHGLAECAADPVAREGLLVRMLRELPDHAASMEALADHDAAAGRADRACGCYLRLATISNYPGQFGRAADAITRLQCDRVTVEPCPGEDPVRPPPQHVAGSSGPL